MNLTIKLNAKLQATHRHDLEDVLEQKFEDLGIDVEITGGGTEQEENGEISSCDIEIRLEKKSDTDINKIIELLEAMLAPVGSQLLIFPEDENAELKKIAFGVHEGLGLYLNNQDLDDDVYNNCDVNFVYEEIERLLGDFNFGHIASHWEGEETALYLYGKSFEEMHKRIKPFLDEYPLCQKCRVVKIA